MPTKLSPAELDRIEGSVAELTWDAAEAQVFVGKISRRERALFELRRLKVLTTETSQPMRDHRAGIPLVKGAKTATRRSGTDGPHHNQDTDSAGHDDIQPLRPGHIQVVRLQWLEDSLDAGTVLSTSNYLLYEGIKVENDPQPALAPTHVSQAGTDDIAQEARVQRPESSQYSAPSQRPRKGSRERRTSSGSRSVVPQRPVLVHETTSEHDLPLPPIPEFLHTTYSCQRPTPVTTPNAGFVEELKKVRELRLLEGDSIGVRAYSTSIATLAAYPHVLQSSFEVSRLPGCGLKIAELYQHWREHGSLAEAEEGSKNERLAVLKLFYDIWGVGDTTAREFYNKGWRDLDDIVEFNWGHLSRVQQIGVKFYDDFKLKIRRPEVEEIGNIILGHAQAIDGGYQMVIVGGYRRDKAQSGDVDVVLSHPDETNTLRFVEKIVRALEKSEHITHTLTLSVRNSERGQTALPWKGEGRRGSGFDTLDKALVVWKDPQDDKSPHRRVDIIVSPWKTAGCAVLGWSGGTTFQRDLRRYCKVEKGLKFDSSGIRSRSDGSWVDVETDPELGPAPDMVTAEKRVFEALDLPYRPPEERCTG